MKNFSISILAVSISACSSWPDHGHGGDAQVDSSYEYYADQVDMHMGHVHESKGDLETQWSIHSVKLDTLVLRGGQECLPARVREVTMMARRSRRELDGHLLEDARNTMIIYQRELDELERRLIYIKRHTDCDNTAIKYSKSESSYSIALNEQQIRSNRKLFLLNLLNDEYSFDVDSDALTRHYHEKLIIAGHYLNQDESMRLYINGHTDSDGDYQYNQKLALKRAQQVQQVLVTAGVDSERLIVRSFGEQLPLHTNDDTLGRMRNRRVSVEFIENQQFIIPGHDGLFFQQGSPLGFPEEQPVKRIPYLKYWNKTRRDQKFDEQDDESIAPRGQVHRHVLEVTDDDWDGEWEDEF